MNNSVSVPKIGRWILVLAFSAGGMLISTTTVFAGQTVETYEFEPLPAPPDVGTNEGEDVLEPEVTIIQREDAVVEEYRIHGQLYGIKITPVIGPPYYLFDADGDGNLEGRIDDPLDRLQVPQWVIFRW